VSLTREVVEDAINWAEPLFYWEPTFEYDDECEYDD
jgi:hypothetical protein